jgi:hypothetical protein
VWYECLPLVVMNLLPTKKESFLLIFNLYKQLSVLLGKKRKWPPILQDGVITTFHWFKVKDDKKN